MLLKILVFFKVNYVLNWYYCRKCYSCSK